MTKIVTALCLIVLGLGLIGCRAEINAGARTDSSTVAGAASTDEPTYQIEVIDDTRLYAVHIYPLTRDSISRSEYILADGLRELVRQGYAIKSTQPIIGRWDGGSPTIALLVFVEPKDGSKIPPIAPMP